MTIKGEGNDSLVAEHDRVPSVNWVQALAGGLAAMSSAVLLSTIGVAGTIIGAAVGSVVFTIGSAVYSHYLVVSRERVAAARAAARRAAQTLGKARWTSTVSDTAAARADREVAQSQRQLREAEADKDRPVRWRELLQGLPWKRGLVASAGVFILVMGTIVTFEMLTGRALSSYTGGTQADGPRTSIPLPGLSTRDDESEPVAPSPDEDGAEPLDGRVGDVPTDENADQPPAEDDNGAPAGEPSPAPRESEPEQTTEPTPRTTVTPTPEATTPAPTAAEETAPPAGSPAEPTP